MSVARFRCMCGSIHRVALQQALDGLGVAHWRCTDCRRRFVLAYEPPDAFTPVYLDPAVRSIEPRDTGTGGSSGSTGAVPAPPPAIDFNCRCGEKITAHSWMYGGTAVCTNCRSTLYLALKYNVKKKVHVIVPEYPHTTNSA
jgi:hypothetical protein